MILFKKPPKFFGVIQLVFRMSPFYALLVMFLSIVDALTSTIAITIAMANFIDTATETLHNSRLKEDVYKPLLLLLLVLFIICTIKSIISLVNSRILLDVIRKFKPEIVKIHASLDYKYIENAKSLELISRVSRNPEIALYDGFDAFRSMLVISIYLISVSSLIVIWVKWVAICLLIFSVPIFLLSIHAGRKNYQAFCDTEAFQRRTDYLDSVLMGRENVEERTLFGYGNKIISYWQKDYEALRSLQIKVRAKQLLLTKGSSLGLNLIVALIAISLIPFVLKGSLSAGMFMGLVSALIGISHQMGWTMSPSLEKIAINTRYMNELYEFSNLDKANGVLSIPETEPMKVSTIEFCNVRFKYSGSDKYILDGLCFKLESGRHYAFVGKNGAGKTTIIKLLVGLYTAYEGEILINGKELREYSPETIKALFSVIYQDFAKYYISLKDNIMFGDIVGNCTNNRISEVVKLAGLDETISNLTNGIDTFLGKIKNNGQDISSGQWQRVAIARSIISKATVKILDEPTSALDPISESQLYTEFEKLMEGKTTLFISHRLGSTKLADEILVIDAGQIVERGSHNELIMTNGQYAQMFEAQRSWYQ